MQEIKKYGSVALSEIIQVEQFAVILEGVMSVEQNVPPRGRRYLCD